MRNMSEACLIKKDGWICFQPQVRVSKKKTCMQPICKIMWHIFMLLNQSLQGFQTSNFDPILTRLSARSLVQLRRPLVWWSCQLLGGWVLMIMWHIFMLHKFHSVKQKSNITFIYLHEYIDMKQWGQECSSVIVKCNIYIFKCQRVPMVTAGVYSPNLSKNLAKLVRTSIDMACAFCEM